MNPCHTCDLSNRETGYRGLMCHIKPITPDKYRIGCSEWREKRQDAMQDCTGANKQAKEASRQGLDAENGQHGILDDEIYAMKPARLEKQLQAQCEGWLANRGYRRMTDSEAVAAIAPGASETRGWFAHLHKPKGNPLMPDLMIYNASMTRCLMVELKIVNTFQAGQMEMIRLGAWKLAHYFETVVKLVTEFEQKVQ